MGSTSAVSAEVAGFLRAAGTLRLLGLSGVGLYFSTENGSIARRLIRLLKKNYSRDVRVEASKNNQLKKKTVYEVHLEDSGAVQYLLEESKFAPGGNYFDLNYRIDPKMIRSDEDLSAYIRGSFLGAGSLANPEKQYHMEFITRKDAYSEDLIYYLQKGGIAAKSTERKNESMVYIKEAEIISDALALMGAMNSVLDFESIRVVKDVRNNVNRLVNCETANLSKTITASMKQLEDIETIASTVGLSKLPADLYEVALARLENQEASLQEIGESMDPPISKSGVDRRFKKIRKLAEEWKGESS